MTRFVRPKETHWLPKLQVDKDFKKKKKLFLSDFLPLQRWSKECSREAEGISFPSPQRSEQPRVFVFAGRAPSSAWGIVHALHGGCLLVQERGETSCACPLFLMCLSLCVFRPMGPPGVLWRNNGCLSFCFSVFVVIVLSFARLNCAGVTQMISEQTAHQLMFLFFGFSWTTSSVLRPHACGSPATPSLATLVRHSSFSDISAMMGNMSGDGAWVAGSPVRRSPVDLGRQAFTL